MLLNARPPTLQCVAPLGGGPPSPGHSLVKGVGAPECLRLPPNAQRARQGNRNVGPLGALPPPAMGSGGDEHRIRQVW